MNNAVGYVRVSTQRQNVNGNSLDAQTHNIRNYANNNNLTITCILQDITSGNGHLQFQYETYGFKNCKHLIVWNVFRFSRNYERGIAAINRLINKNITIHFVEDNIVLNKEMLNEEILNEENINRYYSNLNIHKFLQKLKESQQEWELISTRIKTINKYKRERGECTGGIPPYGLKKNSFNMYEFDPFEIKVVKFIDICCSHYYTTKEVNDALNDILGYTHSDPIVLIHIDEYGDEIITDINTKPMEKSLIAKFLNEYGVRYRKDKLFTYTHIRNIKSYIELKHYIKELPICSDFKKLKINKNSIIV